MFILATCAFTCVSVLAVDTAGILHDQIAHILTLLGGALSVEQVHDRCFEYLLCICTLCTSSIEVRAFYAQSARKV